MSSRVGYEKIVMVASNTDAGRARGKKTAKQAGRPAAKLPVKWRKVAEARCAERGERLTPARLDAYAELLKSKLPLSAYDLIAIMEAKQQRKVAPLTVYRHLDFLMRVGLVHRLETTQSYMTCEHPDHAHKSQYLLCSSCGHVDELESQPVETLLESVAAQRGFQPSNAIVEIKGVCSDCAST